MRQAHIAFLLAAGGSLPFAAVADELSAQLPPPSAELMVPSPRTPGQPSMHPAIVLKDAQGTPVLVSGGPASAERTCDGCHDVRWIRAHDNHSDDHPNLATAEPGLEPAMLVGGNCFLCHVRAADDQARTDWLGPGRLAWADTATLAGTGLVAPEGEQWRWSKEAFKADGSVAAATLGLGRPGNRACGFCHGTVYDGPAPLVLTRDARQRMTNLTGSVFSGQRISDSAMNVAGKDNLPRPFDVHAERMVSCASCHFSPNHPAYAFANRGPDHLQFDARRLAITEYLRRPDHRLARGPRGAEADPRAGGIRRCESCHDAAKVHRWLPRAERHFAAMLCETCHVPAAYAPARQESDWTMPTAAREARVVYRGVRDDGFLPGFRPVLLPRLQPDGTSKLGPNNLVTTYAWSERTSAGNRPIAREIWERAFFAAGAHRPELVRALDRNGDGKLQDRELLLDSEAKVRVARELLIAAGASAPEIAGEIRPYELHHGVSPGRFATRACSVCHAADSRIDEPFVLANTIPWGVTPVFAGVPDGAGALVRDGGGRLLFEPSATGLHVFGHTRSRWLDGFGFLLFAGVFAGATGHALLRVRAARRHNKEQA